jgi:hypothetical protein
MTLITEKAATVFSQGDPSVGIESVEWTLTGEMVFENQEDREEFRESLRQVFGLLVEDCTVLFDSEMQPERPPEWDEDFGCGGLDYDVG